MQVKKDEARTLLQRVVFYKEGVVFYDDWFFIFTEISTMTEKTIHEGRNVKRIREILGVKQDALAAELGLSQQAVSALEQKEKIDDKILEDVAKILNVPSEAIRNMNDDSTTNYFNSFSGNSVNNGAVFAFNSTFNPLDKMVELYEALLKSEREKIALLEKMLDKK